MEQASRVAATAGTRRFLPALRPLLLLGGFVVVWWCLASGTAQAAEEPHHDLRTTTKALAGSADKVLHAKHEPARSRPVAPKVTKVTKVVRHHVAPAIQKVRAEVPAAPAVKAVKAVVRKAVKPVVVPAVEKLHKVLAAASVEAPVGPSLEHSGSVEEILPLNDESSTLQGETATKHASAPVAVTRSSLVDTARWVDASVRPSTSTLEGQDQAASNSPISQGQDARALGTSGSTGASSAQSGSGAGSAAALLESGHIAFPVIDGTLVSAPAGRHLAGPAYPPSSSPD